MGEILEFTIYSITCFNEKVKGIYVGSTKDFVDRQIKHKYASNDKNRKHLKVYRVINKNGGLDNWEFTCLQIRNCTEIDARALEQKWYDKLNADLNSKRPHITEEELLEYKKHYYNINRDKRLEQFKQYNIENKEQRKLYYIENKKRLPHTNQKRFSANLVDYTTVEQLKQDITNLRNTLIISQISQDYDVTISKSHLNHHYIRL